jgi:predicted nucleic acid-binding protein
VTTYIDSSALVAVYVSERFSKPARRALRAVPQVPYTQLHELEVPNAFELLVGRTVMTRHECRTIHVQLTDDLENQRLVRLSLDLDRVFADAYELSRMHTSKFLSRSLDLLHVAAAHVATCRTFISADDRQLAVAKATGLAVIDIKRRESRMKR